MAFIAIKITLVHEEEIQQTVTFEMQADDAIRHSRR